MSTLGEMYKLGRLLESDLERVTAQRDAARAVLRKHQHCVPTTQGLAYRMTCAECHRIEPDHAPDCAWYAALEPKPGGAT